MKKIIALMALAAMLLSLAACGEASAEEGTEIQIVGGWSASQDAENGLPEEVQKMFDSTKFIGIEPVAVLGTQVVAGTNYMILCRDTTTSDDPGTWKLARLYVSLDGNGEMEVADFDYTAYQDEQAADESTEELILCGGWMVAEDIPEAALDEEAAAAFACAVKSEPAGEYTPVALLGTQVVAGTNYAFLAKTTVNETSLLKVYIVYADLEGGYELLSAATVDLGAIEF